MKINSNEFRRMPGRIWAAKEVGSLLKHFEETGALSPHLKASALCAANIYDELTSYHLVDTELVESIVNRLMLGKPLTRIEDTDDNYYELGVEPGKNGKPCKVYRYKRYPMLTRRVYENGRVEYHDALRSCCTEPKNLLVEHCVFFHSLLDEMCPITMPYLPFDHEYRFICNQYVANDEKLNYDILEISKLIDPAGKVVSDSPRFFKINGHGVITECNKKDFEFIKIGGDDNATET